MRAQRKPLAPGLTSRAVLEKPAGIEMLDVHFSTNDGRTLILSRYTELIQISDFSWNGSILLCPHNPTPITAAGQLVH